MLVVTRHRLPLTGFATFADALGAARAALAALALRPGWRRGWVGRAVDDPDVLLLAHEWVDAGSCRRALSAAEVRAVVWPFLQTAQDEASTFELLHSRDGEQMADFPSAHGRSAETVGLGLGLGHAAAPHVSRGDLG